VQIEDKFLKRAQRRKGTKHVLIVCGSVNMIDATGLQMLIRLNNNLKQAGITLSLSDLKGTLLPHLNAAGLGEIITGQIFFSTDRAMRYFAEEARAQAEDNKAREDADPQANQQPKA
jgi:SulP family sulfate permease